LIEGGRRKIHHIMMELNNIDDVGQGYDIALSEPGRIATTLGRHTNDFMMSFYATTPSDFFIEYGWGGRVIDPATWQPNEVRYGPSLWGHDRSWLPADQLAEARAIRAQAARDGLRQPVQVADGNYHAGSSGCTWWEMMKDSTLA
jgi:glyoxalase/bleomycin resistance protein/dioxygenase superfamily protein